MTPELIEATQKAGLNVVVTLGVFGLCVWIVRFMVMRMIDAIDRLNNKIEAHDKNAKKRSRYLKREHERMIKGLDCITTKLQKLNGGE